MMRQHTFPYYFSRLATISTACGLAVVAIGYYPTVRLAGDAGVVAMLWGVSASVLASLVGAAPVSLTMTREGANVPIAILMGTALRFLIVLLLVVLLTFSGLVDRVAFVTWVAISYLVLLLVDTLASVSILKAVQGANR